MGLPPAHAKRVNVVPNAKLPVAVPIFCGPIGQDHKKRDSSRRFAMRKSKDYTLN